MFSFQETEKLEDTLGSRVVLRLLKCVLFAVNHQVFFDNFFTSYKLLEELAKQMFKATGTVRRIACRNVPFPIASPSAKNLKVPAP